MSLLALGIGSAIVKGIGGIVASNKAKKRNREIEQQVAAQNVIETANLQKGVDAQIRAEKDLGNEYKGMTSISPEVQYARKENEQATASAIERASRAGSSSGEIMSQVAKLTSSGQNQTQKISAFEENRRKEAGIAAKGQAVRAAQTGLAGEQAKIALSDKAFNRTAQKQEQSNQAIAQGYNYFSGAVGDITSAAMYADMYGAGAGVNDFGQSTGGGIKQSWSGLFGTKASRRMNRANRRGAPVSAPFSAPVPYGPPS